MYPIAMAETDYTIRPFDASLDDPAEIAALHLGVREKQVAEDNNQFSNILDSQTDLTAIVPYYVEPGGNFWLAIHEPSSSIAGFVGLRKEHDAEGRLKRLSTIPEHRRQHVGLRLAQTLLSWCDDSGFSRVELTTAFTENAKRIYEQVGFIVIGESRGKDYVMERTRP